MKYIIGQEREQIMLLPDCIDDLIEQDNPVRVIDAFIDSLDIDELGFQRSTPNITGRPSYNLRDLLKLYVYGYNCNDQGLLKGVAESTREMLETETLEIVADKGYESREDILNCVMNGIIPNVALKYDKDERLYTIDYVEAEISEDERNSTKPEDIQKCIAAGILPSCYENTAIEVELQEQSELSCFTLNEDRTVTCPMGNILSKLKMRGKNTIYGSKEACRQCRNKCTSSKNHKTVSFGPETKYVPVKMYGTTKFRFNTIPENVPINPFNHTLDRRDYINKKVVLRIREDKNKMKDRMCLSEHPFGTVKWYHGAHYFLCKGKEKYNSRAGA